MSARSLNAAEHRTKERILTQAAPAKIRRTTDAVVLKGGSAFMLTTESGDVPCGGRHGLGLYWRDCRYLDGYELTVNGVAPIPLSGLGGRGFEARHHLTNPDLGPGRRGVPAHTIGIERYRLIRSGVVHEVITLRNHGSAAASLRLALRFSARFDDLFVVKGFVSPRRAGRRPPRVLDGERVLLARRGRDGVVRTTTITFRPKPTRLTAERAVVGLQLPAGAERAVAVTIAIGRGRDVPRLHSANPWTSPAALRRWPERAEEIWLRRSAEVRASNPLFERVLRRALLDLRLLRSRLDGHDYFAAGVPWFVTLFGRDAAMIALQTLPYGPDMACETLRLLARYQARERDPYRDAEPGKILHEFRAGELARLGEIPQSSAYYGSVDATPLFLILAAEQARWTGDLGVARALRPSIDAALAWLDGPADSDGDGFIDYGGGRYRRGNVNQGWKDSGNAIVDADGSLAEPPIALCEVQGYAFRAWRQTAWLLQALGDAEAAARCQARAAAMRERFERAFWGDHLGCYVMARQAGGRPCAVVSSNAGQVLWTGIASSEHAAAVRRRLMAPDMFSGWGIRTLSRESRAYNPLAYHLGSVWPHDNAIVLSGFRRYGEYDAALHVFEALFDAASNFRDYRLPELFGGHDREQSGHRPIPYPVACSPQGWAAGALPHALWNLLGLMADGTQRRLRVVRPQLPAWLDWLEIDGVRVGAARADLRFERAGDGAHVKVVAVHGELDVEPSDEPLGPDVFE